MVGARQAAPGLVGHHPHRDQGADRRHCLKEVDLACRRMVEEPGRGEPREGRPAEQPGDRVGPSFLGEQGGDAEHAMPLHEHPPGHDPDDEPDTGRRCRGDAVRQKPVHIHAVIGAERLGVRREVAQHGEGLRFQHTRAATGEQAQPGGHPGQQAGDHAERGPRHLAISHPRDHRGQHESGQHRRQDAGLRPGARHGEHWHEHPCHTQATPPEDIDRERHEQRQKRHAVGLRRAAGGDRCATVGGDRCAQHEGLTDERRRAGDRTGPPPLGEVAGDGGEPDERHRGQRQDVQPKEHGRRRDAGDHAGRGHVRVGQVVVPQGVAGQLGHLERQVARHLLDQRQVVHQVLVVDGVSGRQRHRGPGPDRPGDQDQECGGDHPGPADRQGLGIGYPPVTTAQCGHGEEEQDDRYRPPSQERLPADRGGDDPRYEFEHQAGDRTEPEVLGPVAPAPPHSPVHQCAGQDERKDPIDGVRRNVRHRGVPPAQRDDPGGQDQ